MIDNLPQNAGPGDKVTTPKGIQYVFDGIKWRGTVAPPTEPGVVAGPQGPMGETGATGPQGEIGPAGSGIANTIVQNTITLGAVTTAPAAVTRTVQRIESQAIGDKLKLIYKLGQVSTGRNDGSGDYLLTLPNGVAFNTQYHPVFTGAIWAGGVSAMAQYFVPAHGGIVIDSHWTNQIMVVPYDATRFRLALTNNNSQTTYGFWSSSWYSTSAASGINLQLHFEIWPTTAPTTTAAPVRMLGAMRPPV